MWNEKFKLLDGSCSVSDIHYYFENIIKKYEKVAENRPIRTYVNKV